MPGLELRMYMETLEEEEIREGGRMRDNIMEMQNEDLVFILQGRIA
jgi:hypothetical protein